MINALAGMLVAAVMFIQLRNPETDALMWQVDPETGEYKLDAEGNKQPIGVRAYSPGSKIYRTAESTIATANIKRGKKGLTGDVLHENQTDLLSRTVYEYVGFDYNGEKAGLDTNRKLFEDPEYVAVREQIANAQADLGNALKKAA